MKEGNPVLRRDRISESALPHERGLSEEGPRQSPTPYLFGISNGIAVLGTATEGRRLPTMEVWRSPMCVSRSGTGDHNGLTSAKSK